MQFSAILKESIVNGGDFWHGQSVSYYRSDGSLDPTKSTHKIVKITPQNMTTFTPCIIINESDVISNARPVAGSVACLSQEIVCENPLSLVETPQVVAQAADVHKTQLQLVPQVQALPELCVPIVEQKDLIQSFIENFDSNYEELHTVETPALVFPVEQTLSELCVPEPVELKTIPAPVVPELVRVSLPRAAKKKAAPPKVTRKSAPKKKRNNKK